MKPEMVRYLGRVIPKENFRAYIYSFDDLEKIVNSWDEFESHIKLGTWFASKEDLNAAKVATEAGKLKSKKKEE